MESRNQVGAIATYLSGNFTNSSNDDYKLTLRTYLRDNITALRSVGPPLGGLK